MTRGRITESRDAKSPDQGKDPTGSWSTVRTVTLRACGSPGPVSSRLRSPSRRCWHSSWSGRAERRPAARGARIWLPRAPAGRHPTAACGLPHRPERWPLHAPELGARPGSARAARPAPGVATRRCDKGERVASCGQFSHTPCGSAVTAAVRASGYRYATLRREPLRRNMGTGLRARRRGGVAPVPAAPRERAQPALSRRRAAPVRANGLLDAGDAVVWTATFASPR